MFKNADWSSDPCCPCFRCAYASDFPLMNRLATELPTLLALPQPAYCVWPWLAPDYALNLSSADYDVQTLALISDFVSCLALSTVNCLLWFAFCCAWLYDPIFSWKTSCPRHLVSICRCPTTTALLVFSAAVNSCFFGLSILLSSSMYIQSVYTVYSNQNF